MGPAAMRRAIAFVGALILGTVGEAEAAESGARFFEAAPSTRLTSDSLLAHSSADGQLSKASARSGDPEEKSGFRSELEAVGGALDIPSAAGNLNATRLVLSGLYEFSSGGWRLKPYVGAGVGFMDVSARLLGHEQSLIGTDIQFKGGVNFNITQKLLGSFEWRWSHGSKPTFALSGIPTKFQLKRGGFLIGVNYKLQ